MAELRDLTFFRPKINSNKLNTIIKYLKDHGPSENPKLISQEVGMHYSTFMEALRDLRMMGIADSKPVRHSMPDGKKGSFQTACYFLINPDCPLLGEIPTCYHKPIYETEAIDRVTFNLCFGKEKLDVIPQHTDLTWR